MWLWRSGLKVHDADAWHDGPHRPLATERRAGFEALDPFARKLLIHHPLTFLSGGALALQPRDFLFQPIRRDRCRHREQGQDDRERDQDALASVFHRIPIAAIVTVTISVRNW